MCIASVRKNTILFVVSALLIGVAESSHVAFAIEKEAVQSSLRIAWSQDGLDFVDGGKELLGDAGQPSMVRRGNGEIILLCQRLDKDGEVGRIVSMRSRNDGRRWTRPKLVQIRDKIGRRVHGTLGTIVLMPDERVQLFFFRDIVTKASKENPIVPILASAISRDGVHFRVDDYFRVEGLADGLHRISTAWIRDRLHLYLTSRSPDHAQKNADKVSHAVSADGRRFVVFRREKMKVNFEGSIVQSGKGYRAYAWNKSGIKSLQSKNGRSWKLEEGMRLDDGSHPAVVALDKQALVMVYEYVDEKADEPEMAISNYDVEIFEDDAGTEENKGELVVDALDSHDGEIAVTLPENENYPNIEAPETYSDGTPISDELGFAPMPNFRDKVDYVKWWKSVISELESGRTYDLQEAFSQAVGEGEWPDQSNMYADLEFSGLHRPWDPAEKPKWETSRLAFTALRARFKEAVDYDGYRNNGYLSSIEGEGKEDYEKLLMNFLLPNLSYHRMVVKSVLSDAWRLTEGKVSSTRMLDAWRTTLVNAHHSGWGATLIEELVAIAETSLLHRTARSSLKYGVFPDDKINDAFEVLKQYDQTVRDPMLWIRGEHAMMMDTTQYLFGPASSDSNKIINKRRIESFISQSWVDEDKVEETIEKFNVLTFEDGTKSLVALDSYYRQLGEMMRVGYPDIRMADIDILEQTFVHENPITEELLPGLSRYYTLRTRAEASRRATQLIYAVHVFKAQENRWPKSLDELPESLSGDFRIDPYSGEDFVYRLSSQGPRIYSVSENGVDDGGVHARRWEDTPDEKTGSDDYVFWPPQP